MDVRIILVFLQWTLVGSVLDGALTSPSTNELLTTINQLKQTVTELQQKVNHSVNDLKQENQSLRQELQHLHNTLSSNAPVAFCATLNQDTGQLGLHQVIHYNRVLTNVGNTYEPRLGHFTAPKAGLYYFTVSAMGKSGQLLGLYIVKNGVPIEEIRSESNAPQWIIATESVVLNLQAGDMIWVAYYYGSAYIHGHNFNSFCGFSIN